MSRTQTTIWRSDKSIAKDIFSGSGAINALFTGDGSCEIKEVRLKLASACADVENFTIDIDSGDGAAYDTRLFAHNMLGVTSIWFSETALLFDGDKLLISWANAGNITYGMTILYRRFLS